MTGDLLTIPFTRRPAILFECSRGTLFSVEELHQVLFEAGELLQALFEAEVEALQQPL